MISPFQPSPYYTNPYQTPGQNQPSFNPPKAQPQAFAPNAVAQTSAQTPAQGMLQRPVYNWGTPAQWVNSAKLMGGNVRNELQKAFPGNYAHLIGWQPVKGTILSVKDSAHVINEVGHHRPVKDHELISFDDNMKRTASLGIATLATVGMKSGVLGVGEFLGMAGWFGAMSATPKLINSMVRLKTGINLNQNYDSTYGQRLNLYKDPNYLPLHLLTKEQEDLAAQKLGIPDGPNRRREVEDKIRQVSVQAHTWGMLAAGPATPVISGLACDLLQDPTVRAINKFKQFKHRMSADRIANSSYVDSKKLADRTTRYLEKVVGKVPGSELSTWWKSFGTGLVKKTGLSQIDKSIIIKGSRIEQREALVDKLAEMAKPDNERLEKFRKFLDEQFVHSEENGEDIFTGRIREIQDKANNFLNGYKDVLSKEHYETEQLQLETRIINAKTTIGKYRSILETIEKARKDGTSMEKLKAQLQSQLLNNDAMNTQRLFDMGYRKEANQSLGNNPETLSKFVSLVKDSVRQNERAAELLGATPESHLLDDALKSYKLGNMWRTRMGLYLGGAVLAATAVYNFTMVGRDFKKPAPEPSQPRKPAGGPA